jgi:hypothetical protein
LKTWRWNMSVNVQVGSIVYGRSEKPLQVAAVEGDILLIFAGSGYRKIHKSAILSADLPQLSNHIQIGDRVWRNSHLRPKYPKTWFVNGVNKSPKIVSAIESAIVERFSRDGVWVKTKDGELYHVIKAAFETGEWGYERTN